MIPKLLPATVLFIAIVITQNLQAQQPGNLSSRNIFVIYDSAHHRPVFNNNYFGKNNLKDASLTQSSFLHLTKDIDTASNSNPINYFNTSFDYRFAVLKNDIYYNADDGVHGAELWKSDGTAAGTKLVRDINPGIATSNVSNIITFKGNIYFIAYAPVDGWQVWKSDGTNAGTKAFKSINNSYPVAITVVNGELFIISVHGSNQWEIWKSDGSDTGTRLAVDLTSLGATQVFYMLAVNNLLYFTAENTSYNNTELWRSDGTTAGTFMLKDIDPDPYGEGPIHLTACNNQLYFFENDGVTNSLFTSDGTITGTDYAPGNNGISLWGYGIGSVDDKKPLTVVGNAIYFEGNDNDVWGVYKYNGVAGTGTKLVMGINYNQYLSVPISRIGSKAYFVLYDNNYVPQLWWANGPSGTPVKIADLPAGAPVTNLTNCGSLMYFNVSTTTMGNEVWRCDGTAENTYLLKDINPGVLSSNANWFTTNNNKTFFAANTLANGTELWVSDGTTNNTYLAKDINTHSTESSNPWYLTPFNNKIIFLASTPDKGAEPYVSNGTNSGTFILKDIIKGDQSSWPSNFKVKDSFAYFFAGESNTALYKTTGKKSDVVMLYDFGIYGRISDYTIANNNIVFVVLYNSSSGYYELWRTDGTNDGTYLLTSGTNYNSGSLVTIGNNAYFPWSKVNGTTGTELWTSDGTTVGTKIVKDIFPGSSSSSPNNLYVFRDTLYFDASNATTQTLWKSDGTNSGTKQIKAVYATSFHGTDSILFFAGNTVNYGNELWKTNGTAAGTVKVKDIYNGTSSSNPSLFNHIGNTLFFMADDGINGMQLWKSNGTGSGTQLLSHLYFVFPDAGTFAVAGNQLYFLCEDTLTASELLAVSDGTPEGTHVTDDSLANALNAREIAGVGNKLFIAGDDYRYGSELYEGTVSIPAKSMPVYTMAEVNPKDEIHAQVINNPFGNQLNLDIYSSANGKVKIQVTSVAGTVYYENSIDLTAGITTHTINTGAWANGIYLIHILNPEMKNNGITLKGLKVR